MSVSVQAAPPRKPSGKREATRRRVIDAAAAEFAEEGYHGGSTRGIADRLGMKQGSLYYHFKSKEAALEEVCRVGVEEFADGLEEILHREPNATARLHAAVANHLTPLLDKSDYVRVFLFERQHLPRDRRAEVARLSRRYEALLRWMFEDGVTAGAFAPRLDSGHAVLVFIGACNMVAATYGRPTEEKLRELIDGVAGLLLGGLLRR